MAQPEDQREAERAAMAKEAQQAREMMQQGILFPETTFTAADNKTMQEIIKCAAIAKKVSKTQIAVRVFSDGKLQEIVEPIGSFDWIFQSLMSRRLGQGTEGTR